MSPPGRPKGEHWKAQPEGRPVNTPQRPPGQHPWPPPDAAAGRTAPAPHILVVEDEPALNRLVCDYLRAAGYTAQALDNGLDVLPAVRAHAPDLVVLDLMLPGLDGLAVCRALRQDSDVPVLMLTARVEEVDRLLGLDAGADDYVCKPFSPREVVARVRAILRRPRQAPGQSQGPLASGAADVGTGEVTQAAPHARHMHPALPGLQLDTDALRARVHGSDLGLTPLEFRLLSAMAMHPGRVFSRDQLLDRLHDDQRALSDRAIDSHVKNLRRKLQQAPADPRGRVAIRSVYGVGYALEPSEEGH